MKVQNKNAACTKWNKTDIQGGKNSYLVNDLTIDLYAFINFSKSPSFWLKKLMFIASLISQHVVYLWLSKSCILSESGTGPVSRKWIDMTFVVAAL